MPASPYVVTSSGDLLSSGDHGPTRHTRALVLSPRRMVAAWCEFFNPFLSLDLSTLTLDARVLDADLIDGFARGGQRVGTPSHFVRLSHAHA